LKSTRIPTGDEVREALQDYGFSVIKIEEIEE